MKYNKNLIFIMLLLFVVGGIISVVWYGNIYNTKVVAESKDGIWRVEYVKDDESFDPINKYRCILTYRGGKKFIILKGYLLNIIMGDRITLLLMEIIPTAKTQSYYQYLLVNMVKN